MRQTLARLEQIYRETYPRHDIATHQPGPGDPSG